MENFPLNKDEYIALEIAKTLSKFSNASELPPTIAERTKKFMESYIEILENVKKTTGNNHKSTRT